MTSSLLEKLSADCPGRILIMDDEEMIRSVMREMLGKKGYDVVTAKDGREAIDSYREAKDNGMPFDVVIVDLTVPAGMGGNETITALREIDPGVKAVVTSGFDHIRADYHHFGFSGCLPKPFLFADLNSMIGRLMEERSMEKK
jgi:DNA-binding NtrC family response regulator